MEKEKLLLCIIPLVVLVGCGGAGSQNNVTDNTMGKIPVAEDTQEVDKKPERYASGYYLIGRDKLKSSQSNDVKHSNLLKINGKEINLVPARYAQKLTYAGQEGDYAKIIGNHLSYARYGVVVDTSDDGYGVVFAHGQAQDMTQLGNVPQSGKVSYRGRAVYLSENKAEERAKSAFTVDFAEKNLKGVIFLTRNKTFADLPLRATLKGNTFVGTYNGVTTNGAFFGKNAEELAGTFINESGDVVGAFGAASNINIW